MAAWVSLGFGIFKVLVEMPVKHWRRYQKELAESKDSFDSNAEAEEIPYECCQHITSLTGLVGMIVTAVVFMKARFSHPG